MTERKPAGMTIESWVERQIRVAAERGELDGLRGAGEPIPPSHGDDEMGWIRRKLEEEGLPTDALLPMSLQLRREAAALPAALASIDPGAPDAETQARTLVSALNRKIAAWLRNPSPPILPISPVDPDRALARWRAAAGAGTGTGAGTGAVAGARQSSGPASHAERSTHMSTPSETHRTPASPVGAPAPADAPDADAGAGAPPRVTVYWRPGCAFCQRLRLVLWTKRLHPAMVNIWKDSDAAAYVRSVAQGNETVPTVVIDGEPHVNPAPKLVVEALRRR